MNKKESNIKICAIKAQDISEIKRIEIECNLSPWTIEDYSKEIGREDSHAFLAKAGDRIVGFIITRLIMHENDNSLFNSDSDSDYECEIEIYNLCVIKHYRRCGIGRRLVEKAIESADCKTKCLWLEVRESNRQALFFYKQMNFKESGIRKNFYRNPLENGVIMKLVL